jgi:hypothetical protein
LYFDGFDGLSAAPIVSALLLGTTTAPLLSARSARRAALRTLGIPFAATTIVVAVSLALLMAGGGRIIAARAEGTDHAALDAWRRSEPPPRKGATDPDWPY